jgi:hypothetical protein
MTKRACGLWSITIKDLLDLLEEANVTLPDWMGDPDLVEIRIRADKTVITFMGIVDEYAKPAQLIIFPNLIHQGKETRP